jgi:hypothetical protein
MQQRSLMQAARKRCKTARKHALRHGMATANSAPHRHSHPSLTRTRRPKKLPHFPLPPRRQTRTFKNRFFRHARLLPASLVVPRYLPSLAARCMSLLTLACHSRPPLLLPLPRRAHRDDRSPRCAISRPGRIFTCDRFSGRARAARWSLRR